MDSLSGKKFHVKTLDKKEKVWYNGCVKENWQYDYNSTDSGKGNSKKISFSKKALKSSIQKFLSSKKLKSLIQKFLSSKE